MAKASLNIPINHPFSSSLGDYSLYMRKDGKLIIRGKGGTSGEKMKNNPKFQKLRDNNSDFGGASSAAKMVKYAMCSLIDLADFKLHSRLTGLIKSIVELDTNPKGKRSIIFSRGKHLLEGFHLNEQVSFDSVVTSPLSYSMDRHTHTAVLVLPPLTPGKNFHTPWKYPYYRFRINLGIIRDMTYIDGVGHRRLLEDPKEYTEMLDTEWYLSTDQLMGQEVGLTILDPVFDETCSMVLSIGIEFGSPSGGKVIAVKNAGCAKLLATG